MEQCAFCSNTMDRYSAIGQGWIPYFSIPYFFAPNGHVGVDGEAYRVVGCNIDQAVCNLCVSRLVFNEDFQEYEYHETPPVIHAYYFARRNRTETTETFRYLRKPDKTELDYIAFHRPGCTVRYRAIMNQSSSDGRKGETK